MQKYASDAQKSCVPDEKIAQLSKKVVAEY
jgi:hypothetical protein